MTGPRGHEGKPPPLPRMWEHPRRAVEQMAAALKRWSDEHATAQQERDRIAGLPPRARRRRELIAAFCPVPDPCQLVTVYQTQGRLLLHLTGEVQARGDTDILDLADPNDLRTPHPAWAARWLTDNRDRVWSVQCRHGTYRVRSSALLDLLDTTRGRGRHTVGVSSLAERERS